MAETQRVAIVTGAAGGIGRAMVQGLLSAGIRVAGVDRDREPLGALTASAREQGKAAELLTIATDLTDDSAADAITKAARGKFGRIDILVNNAGIGPGAIRPDSWQRPLKFWEITPDQWRRFVAVHTTAPLALTNAVVPEMMRQGWGRIVNVTTSLGTMLNAGSPTYGPSKAALEALSAIMAKDLDGTGVTVNVLVPGGITNTPMVSESGFDRTKMIQPEVMVSPLLWLVSDTAASVTGRRFLGVHWDPELPPNKQPRRQARQWHGRALPLCPSRRAALSLFIGEPSVANPSRAPMGSSVYVFSALVGSR
jgi:NAD(P)-dependent dehydrogenase (short-subunit alcohol dehydrogenase family)